MSQPNAKVVSSPCVTAHPQIATATSKGPRFDAMNLTEGFDQSTSRPVLVVVPAYVTPIGPVVCIRLGVSRCDNGWVARLVMVDGSRRIHHSFP